MREKEVQSSPTRHQLGRLYAIASNQGWSHEGVLALIEANYKIFSTKELTKAQYDEVVEFIETSIVPNVTTMRRDKNTSDLFNHPQQPR